MFLVSCKTTRDFMLVESWLVSLLYRITGPQSLERAGPFEVENSTTIGSSHSHHALG